MTDIKERLVNAVGLGMSLNDAYLLCELAPDEMELLEKDKPFQAQVEASLKRLELQLLERLQNVTQIQVARGKHAALTWTLEHLFDRYYKGGAQDGPVGTINLKIGSPEGADIEVHGETQTEA